MKEFPYKLLLCSSSPARRKLLEKLNIPFEVASPDIDETPLAGESVQQLVRRLAEAKARLFSEQYSDYVIIGCDQVIVLGDEILGKPKDHQDAVKVLTKASGNKMDSYTGMCVYQPKSGRIDTIIEPYEVYFRELSSEMIEHYLAVDQPYHCAGSIKAEAYGIVLFEKMVGEDPNALIGLPLIQLTTLLAKYVTCG